MTITVLFCAQMNVRAQESGKSFVPQEDVILRWNRVLMETVRTPGQQPATIMPVRSYAVMHAAMFDAVNSIDESYTPYLTDIPTTKYASIEAAAAQAARDVVAALYPTRVAVFNTELEHSLAGINETRKWLGVIVGKLVAERLLAARANDGWNVTPPPYVLPDTPGN